MAASPLPREPLSGTCNASGNATIPYRAPVHFYVHIYVAIQVSAGNPTYALTLGTASPLIFGTGNQSQLGPVLLQPGERMTLQVIGAGAAATVIAQVMGWQAAQPEDLLPLLPIQPTAVQIANTLTGPVQVTLAVAATATTTSPAVPATTATRFTLISANPARRGLMLYWVKGLADLAIYFGTAAQTTINALDLWAPKNLYEFPLPLWTGQVDGVTNTVNETGIIRVTEIT